MRLALASDLHLERRSLPLPDLGEDFDVLVCAGDLHEGRPREGIRAVASMAAGRPVVVVPGNHDLFASIDGGVPIDLMKDEAAAVAAETGQPFVVLTGAGSTTIDGVRFVGATLWSDWLLSGRWMDDAFPDGDHRRLWSSVEFATEAAREALETGVREYGGIPDWSPKAAAVAHQVEAFLLEKALSEPFDGPTVVVTHHPAFASSSDVLMNLPVPWWTPGFYASGLLEKLPDGIRPEIWISGHVHRAHDLVFGPTRALSNPVEGPDFRPMLRIDLERTPLAALRP